MVLIQVSAPKLVVVLGVGEGSVYGGRRMIVGEGWGGGDEGVVGRAQERSNRQPWLVHINNRPVPHALVNAIAQCLCMGLKMLIINRIKY